MDPSNSGPASLPTTAWPRSSDSPATRGEPPTAVLLPIPDSEWVDDCISTAFPQTARPRSDLLAPFFPPNAPQGGAAQSPIQTPTSAYPPTPVENRTLLGPGYGRHKGSRLSSKDSEYAHTPRFARDVINSPTSVYLQSALPDSLHISRDFISTTSKYQTLHPGPSRSPNLIHLSDLTQSPISAGMSELFPKHIEDVQTFTSSHIALPYIDFPSQSPAQQQHVTRSQPQDYQPQFSASPGPSKSEPSTRTARSSSIIIGLDQGIYRSPFKSSQNQNNQDLFYASQKDDSRFSRHHPSSKGYIRQRANSLDRSSVPTDPQGAKLWDERINTGEQTFTPTNRTPTYQEFRRTTQPVDSPRSDQFPLPSSALSQFENIPAHLRPARKSDLRFHPKLVQEIYEERWKITAGYEDLQAYFSVPKQGPYKHLNWEEWVELYEYLEERNRKVTEREIVFDLKAI